MILVKMLETKLLIDQYINNISTKQIKIKFINHFHILLKECGLTFDLLQEEWISGSLKTYKSPCRSGSLFVLSKNKKFIMKTITKSEYETFKKIHQDYFDHMKQNTLLVKIFGLFKIKYWFSSLHIILMENVNKFEQETNYIYDLKGRKPKRKINCTNEHIIKDNMLKNNFYLKEDYFDDLLEKLKKDIFFLESHHLIDYSLLIFLSKNNQTNEIYIDDKLIEKFGMEIGICDYLISYDRFVHKFTGFIKSFIWPKKTLSMVNHKYYAKRFLKYCYKIFSKI